MTQATGGTTTRTIVIAADDSALNNLMGSIKAADAALGGMGGKSIEGIKNFAAGVKDVAAKLYDLGKQAYDAAQQVVSFAAEGAKIQQLGTAFEALGGSSKELQRLKELTGGLVSDADLMRATNLAKLFNLPAAEIPKLIKLAQGASVALGSTVGKALEDTFTAASRQSKMIADNMGIVMGDMSKAQEAYAKKIGVSVESLTDKQKQLVFVQKMISEGGRQVELAALSQQNEFAKGEVALENFVNKMKVMAAETFVSSGAMDAMMGVFSQVEAMFTDNAGAITGAVMPAFKALVGIVPPLIQVVGALVPLLELAPPVLTMIGAVVTGLAPLLGGLAVALKGVAAVAIDLVEIALWGLISALEITVGLVSDDLAAGFTRAREQIESVTQAANDDRDAFYALDPAARAAATAMQGATANASDMHVVLAQIQVQAFATGQAIVQMFSAVPGIAKASADNVKKLEESFQKITSDEILSRLAKLKESKFAIRTDEDAFKALSQQIAGEFGIANDLVARETQSLWSHSERLIRQSIGNAAKGALDVQVEAYQTVADLQRMEEDRVAFGVSVLGELAMQGVKNKVDAMKKLEEEHERIAAAIQSSAIMTDDMKASGIDKLANEYNLAADAIDAEFEKREKEKAAKRGGGGRDDTLRIIMQAELAVMDEHGRRVAEIQNKYSELSKKLPEEQAALKAALARQAEAEVIEIEAARAQKQRDEAQKLTQFLADENERRYLQAVESANKQAEELRKIAASSNPFALSGIEAQRQAMIGAAANDALLEGPLGGILRMGEAIGSGMSAGVEAGMGALEALGEKTKAETELLAGMFQGMGTAIGDTFMQVAIAGADLRESTFKLMGSLFGQLSTAFLAWATAEGNLLAGNPFAAAGAAIALGVVASAIGAFGSRGKGGGAGGAGAANPATSARGYMDRRRDEGGVGRGGDTYILYGFATPDQINRATQRSSKRGEDLRGRERAA